MKSPTDSTTSTAATTTVKDITNTAMASTGGEGSKNQKTAAARTNNHEPQQLNLETCSPNDLSEYLLHQRFDNDRNKTQTFLEEAIKSVAIGTVTVSSSSSPSSDGLVQKLPAIELGPALLAEPLESSLLLPRAGKFHIQFHKNGLLAKKLNDNTVTLYVPSSNVKHVILFAKPEDIKTICNVNKSKKPKPPNAHLVLLQLSKPVPFQKKEIYQVCFALSYTKTDGPTGPKLLMDNNCDGTATTKTEGSSSWEVVTREWRESVLEKSFPNAVWSQVYPTTTISKQQPFRSVNDPGLATTTGNMPFVKCYHGVQDGVLYPLEEGLLFFKPPKFIPRSQLHSISCGRGGGTSNSSRYVDMHLSLNDGEEEIEFTNIQREEVGVLNKYIHEILIPAMKRDIENDEKEPAVEEVNDQGGGDDNDDDVVVVATKDNDDDNDDTEEDDDDDDDDDDADYQGHDDGEDGDSDDDDENFQDDDDGSDKDVDDEDSSSDDGGGIEVVQDEYATELAKRKKEDSATESDESDRVSTRLKRRRR